MRHMMTPQDIREKSFEKAVFGGYDMAAVDKFLETISTEFAAVQKEVAAMQKENAVLKSKMKVLVDKIEEYRTSEDAMSMALLSAQKMSNEIEGEAKRRGEDLIAESQEIAEAIVNKAQTEVVTEEARLVEAKRRSAEFIEKMRTLCTKQLDFFDSIHEMQLGIDLEWPQEQRTETTYTNTGNQKNNSYSSANYSAGDVGQTSQFGSSVSSIEESISKLSPEGERNDATGRLPRMDTEQETAQRYPTARETAPLENTTRTKFNFEELRFGENREDSR